MNSTLQLLTISALLGSQAAVADAFKVASALAEQNVTQAAATFPKALVILAVADGWYAGKMKTASAAKRPGLHALSTDPGETAHLILEQATEAKRLAGLLARDPSSSTTRPPGK